MAKSIRVKTWLNMMTVLGIILIIMWLLQVVFLQDFYELVKEWDVKAVQKDVVTALSAEDSTLTDNYENILQISQENDLYIEIYDEGGNLVISPISYFFSGGGMRRPNFTMNNLFADSTVSATLSEMTAKGEKSKTIKMGENKDGRSSMLLIDRFECDDINYYVVSKASLIPVRATSEILSRLIIWVFAAMLILSFIMSFIFASSITKPTRALSQAAKEIASGNYDVEVNYSSEDEMGQLVNDFNNMTAELSKVDGIRKDLIANVSHELRTPLTMIKGYAETLRDLTINNPEKREKQLNIIVDESDRLSALITNMLDLSRLQAGKSPLERADFNLSYMLNKLIRRYDIFKDQGYTFNISVAEGVVVNGDYGRLEQVICNLIDNAVNHSVESKTIDINLGMNGTFLVRNYGDVIEPENIKHIWDRYYKIDKTGNRRVTGTGIGLSIVKEILNLHGFKFGVTSDEKNGTVFWVNFK